VFMVCVSVQHGSTCEMMFNEPHDYVTQQRCTKQSLGFSFSGAVILLTLCCVCLSKD
jgi:hypothetical protein